MSTIALVLTVTAHFSCVGGRPIAAHLQEKTTDAVAKKPIDPRKPGGPRARCEIKAVHTNSVEAACVENGTEQDRIFVLTRDTRGKETLEKGATVTIEYKIDKSGSKAKLAAVSVEKTKEKE